MKFHKYQRAILDLIKEKKGDLESMSLRDIGAKIGVNNKAQVVSHHLQQLENKGFIRRIDSYSRRFEVLENPASEVFYIDLYRTTAQCGPEGFLGEDMISDRIPLSSKTFGISNPNDFFLIKSRGSSMEPMIKEGDLVLVKKQDDIESGQIAVVVHEGMPKIKKVVRVETEQDYRYILLSLNNKFPDEEVVDLETDFRICGRVKGVINVQ